MKSLAVEPSKNAGHRSLTVAACFGTRCSLQSRYRKGAVLALTIAFSLVAQERVTERHKAADWPVSIEFKRADIGVEYLTHTVFWKGESLHLQNYLVVEVGVYPFDRKDLLLRQDDFHLLINGKKQPLYPQPAAFVAANLDTDNTRGIDMMGSMGGIGMRTPGARFPGQYPNTLPKPPKVPPPEDRSGVEKEKKLTTSEILEQAALYEGLIAEPVRGHLYFAYKAKPGSIKKVELVYKGGAGSAVLPLF